jgi:4-hydroxybenzoate polyprenyltransferase
LIVGAVALSLQLPTGFGALLALYLATNLAYSLGFKRVALLDVFVLAALYTLRILAGAAAIEVPVSHWLLAFSLFAFLSLALVKRYVEVSGVASRDEERVGGRGYLAGDGHLLGMLGTASAYLAVLVFALYITSPQVVVLYRSPAMLWFAVPLLLYWMSRVWFLANRGELHEDPLLFALRDPQSYGVGALILAAMLAAT